MVNVENLKLCEPPMFMDKRDNVEYFSPEYIDEL